MDALLADILNARASARPVVMGILNITPDSFSDGGNFRNPREALARASKLIDDGAEIIDIGAESTRPGSSRVSAGAQIDRLREVLPAVCKLVNQSGEQERPAAIVSIDTTLAEVADFAIEAGAKIINDVSAGRDDPEIFTLAARQGLAIVLMHMLGQPCDMQKAPAYDNVLRDVRNFLASRVEVAKAAGVAAERCIVDPGIGFGKTLEHNLALIKGLAEFCKLGCPVLLGPSRKRFIGEITNQPDATARLGGTISACLAGYQAGAKIFRVHDVREVHDALKVAQAITEQKQ